VVGSPKPRAQPQVDWGDVGAWIGELRSAAGLSPTEAARQARVSTTTWSALETGHKHHVTDETLIRVAHVLSVDPLEMMARCGRRHADVPTIRHVAPVGTPLSLLELLESDGRLDERSRRLLVELYEALSGR
jgi:transcriptional regulator with XRE-family HTH domain